MVEVWSTLVLQRLSHRHPRTRTGDRSPYPALTGYHWVPFRRASPRLPPCTQFWKQRLTDIVTPMECDGSRVIRIFRHAQTHKDLTCRSPCTTQSMPEVQSRIFFQTSPQAPNLSPYQLNPVTGLLVITERDCHSWWFKVLATMEERHSLTQKLTSKEVPQRQSRSETSSPHLRQTRCCMSAGTQSMTTMNMSEMAIPQVAPE